MFFQYLLQYKTNKNKPGVTREVKWRTRLRLCATSLPDAASLRVVVGLEAAEFSSDPLAPLASRLMNDSSLSLSLITRHHTHTLPCCSTITADFTCGGERRGNVHHFIHYHLRSRRCFQVSFSISSDSFSGS